MAVQTVEVYKGVEKEKQDVARMSAQKKKPFAGDQKGGVLRMTDNDIIKALECCVKDDEGKKGFCNENCPLFGEGYICADFLRSKTLDVIKRQQEQIKKLETIERFATKTIEKQEKEIERLKELITALGDRYRYDVATKECIDYFVKEMTEGCE